MTALRKRFKHKIATVGGKGKAAEKIKRQEEAAAKKWKEEAHRLAQEEENWLQAKKEQKKILAKD